MKQYNYKLIAIAGTFDRLHKGHRCFISEAFNRGEKVMIGLTSDDYVREKLKSQISNLKTNVNNYQDRKNELENFLQEKGLMERAEIVKIDNIYGPAIADSEIEALIVTAETLEGADQVNEKRQAIGLTPLKILQIPLILAEDHHRIASTRIRQGEIDRLGRVFNQIFKFPRLSGIPQAAGQFSPVSPGEAGRAIFKIPEDLRQELKKPLGELIEGDSQNLHQVADKLKEAVRLSNPVIISTVGDEVTKLCNEVGITINLAIIDFKVGREEKYHSLEELGFYPFVIPSEVALDATESRGLSTSSSSHSREISPRTTFGRNDRKIIEVGNPPGHITKELVNAVKIAYMGIITDEKQRIIQVDGEEDLAGVPAILLAPLGSIVLYGQPGEGVVLVRVNEEKKQELMDLITNNI